jgi:hypothetical protein
MKCEIDNKLNDSDVKNVKIKLLKNLELRQRPARSVNQQLQDETYSESEVILKEKSGIVKKSESQLKHIVIPIV